VVGSRKEYGGSPAGGLFLWLTRELRWASETGGVLPKIVVADEFGGIVEEKSEVDGGPITFIPVGDAPDRLDPITAEVLVAVWLVVECGSGTVRLVCGGLYNP